MSGCKARKYWRIWALIFANAPTDAPKHVFLVIPRFIANRFRLSAPYWLRTVAFSAHLHHSDMCSFESTSMCSRVVGNPMSPRLLQNVQRTLTHALRGQLAIQAIEPGNEKSG